jgi:hypothetical protein
MRTGVCLQIMVAVYNHNRLSYIYFFCFLLIGTFFIMNLFTAVVYSKYQECKEADERQALGRTEHHLRKAFSLLDADGSGMLSRDEIFSVMAELRKAHMLPDLPQIDVRSLNANAAARACQMSDAVSEREMQVCFSLSVGARQRACTNG